MTSASENGGLAVAARLSQLALVLICVVVVAAPAGAITGGAYDGTAHPYVAFADNGTTACSGTLLSSTVLLTAAHCFSGQPSIFGRNSATGAPIVRVSFDPNLINTPEPARFFYFGSFYADPAFQPNLPNNVEDPDTHDVAIVVLTSSGCSVPYGRNGSCGPVSSDASLGQYGSLPSTGLVDALPMNTWVEIVGFGVQDFVRGGGPCSGPCKPAPGNAFTRFSAVSQLIASNDQQSGRFVKLHQSPSGVCFGDSGGPDVLAGTHTVLAVNSFVANNVCSGVAYSYRVDTPSALAWIRATIAQRGASL
jgi:Trypsin